MPSRTIDFFHQQHDYGVTVTELYEDGARLQAKVKVNSYAFQSHAVVSAWTPNGWVEVDRLIPNDSNSVHSGSSAFGCPSYASRDRDLQHEKVLDVANGLLERARAITVVSVPEPDGQRCPHCDSLIDEDGYCTEVGCPNMGKTFDVTTGRTFGKHADDEHFAVEGAMSLIRRNNDYGQPASQLIGGWGSEEDVQALLRLIRPSFTEDIDPVELRQIVVEVQNLACDVANSDHEGESHMRKLSDRLDSVADRIEATIAREGAGAAG